MQDKLEGLKNRQACILGHEKMFESAVAMPLLEINKEFFVLFEKRASSLLHQPGEISFPGGKIETSDGTPVNAAIRETCEELGLERQDVHIICPLDIMVSPFNVIVYPFLCMLDNHQAIVPNPDEVDEVFCVPLKFFKHYKPLYNKIFLNPSVPQDFPFDMIPQGKNYPFRPGVLPQVFYVWEEKVIWGLTARILSHFLELIAQ